MIVHQIEARFSARMCRAEPSADARPQAMRDAGVTEVILAINYQPQVMHAFIAEYEPKLGVKITISQARGA